MHSCLRQYTSGGSYPTTLKADSGSRALMSNAKTSEFFAKRPVGKELGGLFLLCFSLICHRRGLLRGFFGIAQIIILNGF
jgi:hypothetical protein